MGLLGWKELKRMFVTNPPKTVPYHCELMFAILWYVLLTGWPGILRYKVDFQSLQADEPLDDVDLDDY